LNPSFACSDQDSTPTKTPKTRKARKGAKKGRKPSTKAAQVIEYISVPKHWFTKLLHHKIKTAIRPLTKSTRRKEQLLEMRIPQQIFVDLMKPMDTGDMDKFEWVDESKSSLKPTDDKPSYEEFKYEIKSPSLNDKFFRLEDKESTHKVRKEGRLVPSRWGLGCSRLHLSTAAEERGERTDLLAAVTGVVTVYFKVPKKEEGDADAAHNAQGVHAEQGGSRRVGHGFRTEDGGRADGEEPPDHGGERGVPHPHHCERGAADGGDKLDPARAAAAPPRTAPAPAPSKRTRSGALRMHQSKKEGASGLDAGRRDASLSGAASACSNL
jgi:hypothetical protein